MIEPRILLMGSPTYAIPAFDRILASYPSKIIGVFSQPDRPKGRSKELCPTPVSQWAKNHHLAVFTPESKFKVADQIEALSPTLIVVIAYGMILPKSITDRYFCINVHASILPQYRGPSPIHAAILNNDTETGVTLIHLNERMDAGNIISVSKCLIEPEDNFEMLHDRLAELGANSCLSALDSYFKSGSLPEFEQNESLASYCSKNKPEDQMLNQFDSPQRMMAKIRAFAPTPGATIVQNGKRIKIIEARLNTEGNIDIIKLKPEGKNTMSYADYLSGHPEGIKLC